MTHARDAPAAPLAVHVIGGGDRPTFRGALEDALAALRSGGIDVRATVGGEDDLEDARAGSLRVLVCGRPTAELLARCPRLERLVIPWAGLPPTTRDVLLALPESRRPVVHNLHHNAASTAELALGLLLAAARRIPALDARLRTGDWRDRYARDGAALDGAGIGGVLDGGRAVVLGYGAIGRRVGRALAALGMEVVGVRRGGADGTSMDGDDGSADGVVRVVGRGELDATLDGAHVLICACPLTKETSGLVDGARLDRLAPGAIVVNVARGEVIDEDALHERVHDGRLGGAGLDAWWRYPEDEAARATTSPGGRRWHELPTVAMTPHVGGAAGGDASESARAHALVRLLEAIATADRTGGAVPDEVDPERGY